MFPFSKNKAEATDTQASQKTTTSPAKASLLAEGLEIHGNVTGDGDLTLQGTVYGDIQCRKLIIGKTGCLHGRVIAQEVIIVGYVEGEVQAGFVHLSPEAEMIGNVYHEVLKVDPGAKLEGRYSRADMKQRKEKAVYSPSPKAKAMPTPKISASKGNNQAAALAAKNKHKHVKQASH